MWFLTSYDTMLSESAPVRPKHKAFCRVEQTPSAHTASSFTAETELAGFYQNVPFSGLVPLKSG